MKIADFKKVLRCSALHKGTATQALVNSNEEQCMPSLTEFQLELVELKCAQTEKCIKKQMEYALLCKEFLGIIKGADLIIHCCYRRYKDLHTQRTTLFLH